MLNKAVIDLSKRERFEYDFNYKEFSYLGNNVFKEVFTFNPKFIYNTYINKDWGYSLFWVPNLYDILYMSPSSILHIKNIHKLNTYKKDIQKLLKNISIFKHKTSNFHEHLFMCLRCIDKQINLLNINYKS